MKTEFLYTKMDEIFGPQENFSKDMMKDKWRVLPYEGDTLCGNMIVSDTYEADDLYFDPKLTGWYKIYIGLMADSQVGIKLSSERNYMIYSTSKRPSEYHVGKAIEENLWRCVDMTGERIEISKKVWTTPYASYLASIRFVPMTDAEIYEYKYECSRTDTKNLYATDDMHNRLYFCDMKNLSDWDPVVLKYENSDVEWISMEDLRMYIDRTDLLDNIDNIYFSRFGDKMVAINNSRFDFGEVLKHLVDLGHDNGYRMSVSLRMGAWGMGFPYDGTYFDNNFAMTHTEWRCIDRNGDMFNAMSYAFPEVQKHITKHIVQSAESGCDAVTLIAHRGIPYVQYEKPVADRFYELYGEYPYELPLDEPRLHALHCEIMTEFARGVRKALDETYGKDKVKLHLRTMYSLHDTKYIGIDVEEWAKEGLIDTVIVYPQRHYDLYDGDIWQGGKEYRIDIDKYTDYVVKMGRCSNSHLDHDVFYPFIGPYTNYKGEMCGPKTEWERIDQWNSLEKRYGVKVYIELMPRLMYNEEFRKWALDLYGLGVKRFGIWDSFMRVWSNSMWKTLSKIGHKEDLAQMDTSSHVKYYRISKLGAYHIGRYSPTWGG